MNFSYVIRQLGLLTLVLSGAIVVVAMWDLFDWLGGQDMQRYAVLAHAVTAGIGFIVGGAMWFWARRGDSYLGRREALLLVALSWLFGAALAGLPYWLWAQWTPSVPDYHPFRSFVDCYFEAMSGLTTTGATVLNGNFLPDGVTPHPASIEALPRGILLWRATTHWLGGLGIVVLFVAVLPSLGVGGKKLFHVESPGPTPQGVRPRIRETARILWLIYLGMTIAETLALTICGLSVFDAVCHTFATLATGGFSTRNASIAAYDSLSVEITIVFFMVLAGVNFGLYYHIIRGRFGSFWQDRELRLYLTIIFVAALIVMAFLIEERIVDAKGTESEPSIGAAIRHGIFQVVSIMTTTGFVTADFDRWGFFPKAVLIGLMFVGASAGSTGGGIKVIRLLIAFKVMVREVERVFRPNVVRPIKIGDANVDPELRLATMVYVVGILLIFLGGALSLMAFEAGNERLIANQTPIDFATASSATAATLNNIGPGLSLVGAVQNYGWFTAPSKVVMSILMALGRLEVYAIFVLLVPRFWRSE